MGKLDWIPGHKEHTVDVTPHKMVTHRFGQMLISKSLKNSLIFNI